MDAAKKPKPSSNFLGNFFSRFTDMKSKSPIPPQSKVQNTNTAMSKIKLRRTSKTAKTQQTRTLLTKKRLSATASTDRRTHTKEVTPKVHGSDDGSYGSPDELKQDNRLSHLPKPKLWDADPGCKSADLKTVLKDDGSPDLLECQPYYHGLTPREEILDLLKTDGDFIVRDTNDGNVVKTIISVYWSQPRHYVINLDSQGRYQLEGPRFTNIPDLIKHYFTKSIPLTKDTKVRLLKPITKDHWDVNPDNVVFGKQLGEGNFGEVFMGEMVDPATGMKTVVALKTYKESMPDLEKKKFLREARIMRRYRHENVASLIGVCTKKEPLLIILEFIPGGSLEDYLIKNKGKLTGRDRLEEKIFFCLGAAKGMQYLASQACLHRDLASRNCLLGDNNIVKISDFGQSREGVEYKLVTSKGHTPIRWTALEVCCGKKYTVKADVWSFGVLMWEIFTDAERPYPEDWGNKELCEFLKSGQRLETPKDMPEKIAKAMNICWKMGPELRPEFDDIVRGLTKCYKDIDKLM